MDAAEGEASAQSEGKEGGATSSQVKSSTGSEKASLKRPADTKAKRKKRDRLPTYTVHQGEDMLLVISNTEHMGWTPAKKQSRKNTVGKGKLKAKQTTSTKNTARAKTRRGKKPPVIRDEQVTGAFVPRAASDNRWGQNLPEEVLINIFRMVVGQDGAVPFLCRAGRVCRLWNAAASSPVLWRSVTVGHCWIAPGKSQRPKTVEKVQDTVKWLAQNRFSQLRDFSLCHWKENVDFALEVVSQFCPQLHTLKLSHCSGLTAKAFHSLGQHSRCLQSLNVQDSEVQGLVEYLGNHGNQIKQLLFSRELPNDRILAAISRGCCPDLQLLEVNKRIDSEDQELFICIPALQIACPKLKTFRLLNVRLLQKSMRPATGASSGFPLLEELCIANTTFSYFNDKDLLDILFSSPRLRVLDLRGCARITPYGLAVLPCPELECLFWGHYSDRHSQSSSSKSGLHMVTKKWSQTLRELDISNQLFPEDDLDLAMNYLAQATETDMLRSLNLSGTRITQQALRLVLGQMTSLRYLNISSCRYLPRGLKRIYRGQEDICQLLDRLE